MDEKKYFDKHWDYNNQEISLQKFKVAKKFLSPLINEVKEKVNDKNIKILDVGCGDGVHLKVINDMDIPINFCGIDISDKVISYLNKTYDKKNVVFKVADALKLPFKDESFDAVFSFGVLGYTSNPTKAFKEKIRVLKTGGKLGVWLYPQKKGIFGFLFSLFRFISNNSNDFFKARISDFIVPFLYFLPTRSGLNLSNSTYSQCREVVMVNIAPDNLIFFDKQDVFNWFKKNNIQIDFEDEENPITIWGTKL
jgi:ubiquinone/menaquinone biosynthesis C-methylase UbiE